MTERAQRPPASWATIANLCGLIGFTSGISIYVKGIENHAGDNSTRIEQLDIRTTVKIDSLEKRIDREGDQTRESLRRIESKLDTVNDKLDLKANRSEIRGR